MPDCSLGIIFNNDLEQVLLVHKNRPAWQKGLINGVGGKIEPGETPLDCMVRECQEETLLDIKPDQWENCATIKEAQESGQDWTIEVFVTSYQGDQSDAQKNDHEEIEWFPNKQLPDTVISNLHFLIPLAHQKLLGHNSKEVLVRY